MQFSSQSPPKNLFNIKSDELKPSEPTKSFSDSAADTGRQNKKALVFWQSCQRRKLYFRGTTLFGICIPPYKHRSVNDECLPVVTAGTRSHLLAMGSIPASPV